MSRRLTSIVLVCLIVVLVGASPAGADPAGPTNYVTSIISVEPPSEVITVEAVAGDSFILLTVEPGHEVEVVGYQREPYLRFETDGTVRQNENSPSRWLNDDRYGNAEAPASATPEAEPDWVVVSTDGSYAWHDHRAHWMNRVKPPGAQPGDTVLEEVVPLVVDGQDVSVSVRSVLLSPPSPWPPVAGLVVAITAVVAAFVLSGLAGVNLVAGVWSLLAVGLGVVAYRSVPSETEPSFLLWVLPLVALAAAIAAVVMQRRNVAWPIWAALVVLAGAELMPWGWYLRSSLTRAYIPTEAPFWLHRFSVAGAFVVGLAAIIMAIISWLQPANRSWAGLSAQPGRHH